MNRQTWIAVLALVGVAAVYVLFIRKTDEDRIRAQLAALSAAVREDEGDNIILRAARIEREFPRLFTPTVEVHVPDMAEGKKSRADLSRIAIGSAKLASKIDLRFSHVHVEIDRPPTRGWVMADATVSATLRDGGGHMESKPLALRFDKDDEGWKIADIAVQGAR